MGRKLCDFIAMIPVFGLVKMVKGCLNERRFAFVAESFRQKCMPDVFHYAVCIAFSFSPVRSAV